MSEGCKVCVRGMAAHRNMAKTKSSPVQEAPAPTVPEPVASGRRSESLELIQSEQTALAEAEAMAAELAGIVMDEPQDEAPVKASPAKTAKAEPSTPEIPESEFDPDAPVLGEEDEDVEEGAAVETDDDDESEDENPKVEALKKENFKQREKARELKETLATLQAEKDKLTEQLKQLETQPTGLPDLGAFAAVKTEQDILEIESKMTGTADWLEELLDQGQDTYELKNAAGELQEYSRADLRKIQRETKGQLKLADRARSALKVAADSETLARKKYPFVFNSKSPHNGLVLDLVKETPALNALPNKAVILGRLAVGKLVESGGYALVKIGAKPATAAPSKVVTKTISTTTPPPRRTSAQRVNEGTLDRLARGDSNAAMDAAMALLDGQEI
jgi:hypothetical protein